MKIKFSKRCHKFLTKVPNKHARQLKIKLLELQTNPEPQDAKALVGYDFMRVDVGEYRIIYKVENDILCVYLVGKRKDGEVYKKLKRML